MKLPRLSLLPFRLQVVRGHVIGLPTPLENTKDAHEYNRELYFFNIAAVEAGYGAAQSQVVTLQASFDQRRLDSVAVLTSAGGVAGPAATKVHLSLHFADQRAGLE